jgi:hypothetical protein
MGSLYKLSLGALAIHVVGVIAQDIFEPEEFNITKALIQNGVNVSATPVLSDLAVQSSLEGCPIAVSRFFPIILNTNSIDSVMS